MDDAQNWRDHVQTGEYRKIDFIFEFPEPELIELRDALQKIVPQKTFGDGMETFIDYILPADARNTTEYDAAELLKSVQQHLDTINDVRMRDYRKPLEQPVLTAIDVLRIYGITYYGLKETYIFWSDSRQRWVQIDARVRHKIFSKGQRELGYKFSYEGYWEFDGDNSHLPMDIEVNHTRELMLKELEWQRKYWWRGGSRSIYMQERNGRIEPFTTFWHAFNILRSYEEFRECFNSLVGSGRYKQVSRIHLAIDLSTIADTGRRIGESYDAIRKKQAEYETLAYRSEKQSRSIASGKKSSNKKIERIESYLKEIEKLGDLFPRMNERSIVDQAFENVVGKHPELWKQGKGQKESYLSQHIRSEEPYKSRYYAIFGKTA